MRTGFQRKETSLRIITAKDSLILKFEGWERVLALKRQLVIPREKIIGMEWHEHYFGLKPLWRVVGTGAPGMLFAGYFRSQGMRYFLYVRKPKGWRSMTAQNVLFIRTHDFKFGHVIISIEPKLAAALQKWRYKS